MADKKDSADKNTPAPGSMVDVDAIEVSVLILAKHPNGQKQTAAFLNKRGWPTTVTGSISEALDILVNDRPDVVLVSFNHPHPAILRMPEVLVQTFNVFCVGYVETADALSTARLAQVKMLYKLQGFPSGPSVQRLIRRVLEERLSPLNQELVAKADAPSSEERAKQPGAIVVKGEKISSGKYTMESVKVKQKFKDITSAQGGFGSVLFADKAASNEFLVKLKQTLLPDEEKALDSETAAVGAGLMDEKEIANADDKLEKQALLEQAVESALKKNLPLGGAVQISQAPIITNRVAVMPVESPILHGYLVACPATPLGKSDGSSFLKAIKTSLAENFVALSVPGSIESAFWVDIVEVDFAQWTAEAALFSLKVPFDGREIGVGYFPTSRRQPRPKKSTVVQDMYSISIKEVATDVPVNFKAYLPMDGGNEPYLYLRNGRTLQPEQKERLLAKNVTEFCIKGVDLENFKAFLAAMHLHSTIKKKAA